MTGLSVFLAECMVFWSEHKPNVHNMATSSNIHSLDVFRLKFLNLSFKKWFAESSDKNFGSCSSSSFRNKGLGKLLAIHPFPFI